MNYSQKTIERRLHNIYETFGLKEQYILSTTGSFYVAKLIDNKGNFFILKMLLKKGDANKKEFLKEIKLWKILKAKKQKILTKPNVIICETMKSPPYLLYSFIQGKGLGHFYFINKLRVKGVNPEDIVKKIQYLQKNFKHLVKMKNNSFNTSIYRFYTDFCKKLNIQNDKNIIQGSKLLLENRRFLLKKIYWGFSHNDLNPRNIIRDKKGGLTVIDWSDYSMNLITFDFVFIYLASFNNKNFSEELLRSYLKLYKNIPDIEKLIDLTVIILLPKFLNIIKDDKKAVDKKIRNKELSMDEEKFLKEINSKAKKYMIKILKDKINKY